MPEPLSALTALRSVVLILLLAMLAACAPTIPRSYVVLVPDPDGKVGQVIVSGTQGEQRLTQAGAVAGADGRAVKLTLSEPEINAEFGAAKAAQPALPEHFMLYFVSATTRLTADSEALLQTILNHWQARSQGAITEILVIGHTDTVGSEHDNVTLSAHRARIVADRLRASGLKFGAITLASHGEKQLLIPTPDETPEPLNRRVQVTIR
jgi:outer membrane protein OmpA-like peptidoglycan-associated protein